MLPAFAIKLAPDADALFLAEVFEGVVGIERIDAHFKLLAIARGVGAARRALQELRQFESIHELQQAIARSSGLRSSANRPYASEPLPGKEFTRDC